MPVAAMGAAAQDYPNRPIRVVVGFAPGGGGDAVARVMAEHMSRTLKHQVIVENKPGAGTTLAPAAVAAAAPDGYTLLLAPDSVFGADKVMWAPNVKYDETNFTPISRWASTFFVLAANKDYGVRTVAELLAKVKAGKGELFVGSTQGLYPALIMENFSRLSGVKLNQVPYKGGAPAVVAVVGGEVPTTFAVPSSVMPMVKEGKLHALAITSANRSALAEGIPTLAESGLKGFEVGYWFGLAGPAGLPPEVAQKLFDASSAALADPGVRAKLHMMGYEPSPSKSVAEFKVQAVQEGAVLRKTVEALGIKGN
ncbi:MAG: tripartite tricarboxylate transporter substrate binding protein [Comamonadaceae bacterium]|nr:MAG: tripartite tricarboxylate transporter substrate binding protein [Comamonadaceae bacterium]